LTQNSGSTLRHRLNFGGTDRKLSIAEFEQKKTLYFSTSNTGAAWPNGRTQTTVQSAESQGRGFRIRRTCEAEFVTVVECTNGAETALAVAGDAVNECGIGRT
jgi:hypothetical protein